MKITINQWFFRGLCLVLLGMFATNIGAQHYKNLSQEEKEQKSIALINEADAFVIGTMVSSKPFYGKDSKTIYTKTKIKVKHWYKGEGKRFIYVIRRGGVIGADNQSISHRSGPRNLHKEYFMLLSKKDKNYKFVSETKATFGRYSDTRYDDFKIIAFYDVKFNSIDELNEFVRNLEGIKMPSKKKELGFQKSSSSADTIVIDEVWLSDSVGTLHAGTGEILIIKGQNFGSKGDILFIDANSPGERLTKLENKYIDDWTSTEIRVIVPSLVRQGSKSEILA